MSEQHGPVTLHHGDCLDILATLPDCSIDAVVTDPPYGLANTDPAHVAETITRWVNGERDYLPGGAGFMGKAWDAFVPPVAVWDECLRVLKPGGHVLAFAGSRTVDLMTLGLRLAGFDIRDSVAWLYGSGFPKSLDVSKAIDKAARGVPQGSSDPTSPNHGLYRTTTTEGKRWSGDSGQGYGAGGSRFLADGAASGSATEPAESGAAAIAPDAEPWQGWGTALKPAFEPVVVARKPLSGTVAANVLAHGTGALNIDGCRVDMGGEVVKTSRNTALGVMNDDGWEPSPGTFTSHAAGRWPANVVLDKAMAGELDRQSGECPGNSNKNLFAREATNKVYGEFAERGDGGMGRADNGGASRFFYVAKADASERVRVNGTAHPTVKPLSLMRWLVRLVTPPGGTVLEPFAGSGTTVEACILEGFDCIAIEREADYLPLIRQRINRRRDPVEAVKGSGEDGGLFDLLGNAG